MAEWCKTCGVPHDKVSTEKLWDIYYRIEDGRCTYEPLVFTSDWMQENVHDEEDHDAVMYAMEKDMRNRGLCIECARPDLSGVTEDMVMSHEEAREVQESWAIEAAERRAGC